MIERDALEEQFSSLGIDVSTKVLEKCEELCLSYGLNEEELVETWMAFSLTHLGGSDPTLDTLTQMERKELAKKDLQPTSKRRSPVSQTHSSPLIIYNVSHLDTSLIQNDEILEAYNAYTTPKAKRTKHINDDEHTPETTSAVPTRVQFNTPGSSPVTAFSPASYCSLSQPSQRYSGRTNAGEVRFHFGPSTNESSWKPSAGSSFLPKIAPYNSDSLVKTNALYMFEKMSDEVTLHNQLIEYLGQQIMEKHSLVDPEPCAVPFQELVATYGRILTKRLMTGTKAVLLEGSLALSHGQTVELELGDLQCSLFPGQVVVVEGTNPTGSKIVAERIHTAVNLPPPRELPNFSSKEGPLQLVVAAGPFTQLDSLNYQPLEDLLKYIVEHKPHIVILIGPFIDALHPHIRDGMLAETFETHFEKMIEKIMEPCKGQQTQVVMIPSWRDVHHQPIYPTPPFAPRKTPNNMHFMSDPSTISIQGLVVGVTSLDVIKDLSANEVARFPGAAPRLHRLASHLLSQQCYYPLYPPPQELNVDSELFTAHAHMDVTPHILILPSELRYFAVVMEGCLILNPERLTRGMIGGTFARIEVPPPASEDYQAFINSISCNIVSI